MNHPLDLKLYLILGLFLASLLVAVNMYSGLTGLVTLPEQEGTAFLRYLISLVGLVPTLCFSFAAISGVLILFAYVARWSGCENVGKGGLIAMIMALLLTLVNDVLVSSSMRNDLLLFESMWMPPIISSVAIVAFFLYLWRFEWVNTPSRRELSDYVSKRTGK